MKVVLTGAAGFLGWHTRARLHALTGHEIIAVDRDNWSELADQIAMADAVMHVAGVNRGPGDDVEHGNVQLARDVADAVQASSALRIVFANSIQAGNGTPYGTGKGAAFDLLATAASAAGGSCVDVRLPNLFGEHGRPHYNSFVATFAHAVLLGERPEISDRPVELLHVQGAAQALIDALATDATILAPTGTPTTVDAVYRSLAEFADLYREGEIPALRTDLDVDLFNTLRSATFPDAVPIELPTRSDQRGALTETVRAHGGTGQTFVSTTNPGVTRGEHFHLRKIERFVVVRGTARIALRRLFAGTVVDFAVDGGAPVAIDMPTMWAHNITNTGTDQLITLFWTNELFDPTAPDTFPEPVGRTQEAVRC